MTRLAVIGLILALAACGGQDGSSVETSDAGSADVAAGADPAVQGCLELVGDEQFAEAVPACMAALEQVPDSERAQAALEQARAGLASVDAGAAQLDATAGELEEAAGALPGTTD